MIIKDAYAYQIYNPTNFDSLGGVFGTLLPQIFIIAGLLLFAYLIFGGFKFLTSGGNEDSIEQAKNTITTAVIGMIIIFAFYWIIWIFQTVFGVDFGLGATP